ncbi:peptide ABC transporter substrate-binding protein [Capsulimonas corticalis]|uniref:Peptide ABC transporter substrate-binding protein n=1 Tax=Capsulimonas corticalis TaxID=2219043 RepID=A0A402CX06_9BACT|nr:peptide ABC transporter substrate-binding protein [Capsulimonas corticalis]BDI34345.1 peptide ABC transporter substrate-binding protein [Capsulimonas corticalis]
MISRPRLAALALLPSLAVFAGCGHKDGAEKAPSDNIFHIAMTASPTTFDPIMVEDGTTIDMLQQVSEGLVQWTPENKVTGALAKSWDVSKDGRTYTFHLRDGVKFQDGNPMTAQDVYYSFKRAFSHKLDSPVSLTYLGDIVGSDELFAGKATELTGVKVIDPLTVAITIKKPKTYWIYTLTYPTGYILSKAEAKEDAGLTDAGLAAGAGTGPFRLTSYAPDSKVTLTANPGYWGGAPKIAGQERLIVIDAATRHSLYLSGKIDIVDEQKGDLDSDSSNAAIKDQVKFWPRAATYYIGLNQGTFAPFKDVRVRQALAYATDKQKIRHVVLRDNLDVAEDILAAGIPGADPSFKGIPYDPAKARELLAAAGYPGGKGFPAITIAYRESYPDLDKTVDLLRGMWKDNLGIDVQGKRTQWTVLLDLEHKNQLDSYHIRWAADYLDPQDYYTVLLTTHGSENHTGYSNPTYDALCDKADSMPDGPERNALYRQAARIVADDVPMIPLYYQKDIELVKPYVKNIDDGLMGHLPYKNLTLAK